jgi:phage terminase large subunit-like protein
MPLSGPILFGVRFSSGYRGFLRFAEAVELDLEPFQRKIARGFFSDQRELLVLLPRGNGKTTLMAALALHHLLTHPAPRIYCGAASVAQARILFEAARDLSRKLPNADERVVVRSLELRQAEGGGVLRMIPADGPRTHGLTPTLAILDELWAHRDAALLESMLSALIKHPDAKLVVISTADIGEDRPLVKLRARALSLPKVARRGPLVECEGDELRALLWEVADDIDADDIGAVAAVNPASWITEAGLRRQREALPEGAFLRFHANARVQREGAWLPAGAWQRCVGEPRFELGERIWLALDVGGAESATALVWISESLHVGCWIGYGDEAIFGALDRIRELREDYFAVELCADPWRAKQAMMELEREGMRCVELPQTDVRICPASQRLRSAIVEQRLTLPHDAELSRHAANAVQRHVRRGWRLDKPDRTSPIDGVISLAMALDRCEQQPEPVRLVGWI